MLILPIACSSNINMERFQQLADSRYDDSARQLATEYVALIRQLEKSDTQQKLQGVNHFFNSKLRFVNDSIVWGESDYWASPLEFIGKQAGDCEDFTIAKFATLRLLKIPVDKLRLTYVKAAIGGVGSSISQAHMVLSYYESPNSTPLILDNLLPSIRPANERPDLSPVFGFNSEGLWVGNSSKATQYDPKSRVSRWREVLQKIQDEGLN